MKHSPAYYPIRGIMKLMGSLPLGFHLGAGKFVAWLMGSVIGYRRDVIMTNLSRSFPDKKYDELVAIKNAFYRSLGYIACEAIWFGASSRDRLIRQNIVRTLNTELLSGLLENSRSAVVLCGHFGNWELFGGIPSYDYRNGRYLVPESSYCCVHKELSSSLWEDIFHDNRLAPLEDSGHYDGFIESGRIVRYVYTHRLEPKLYFFINDQSPYSASPSNIDLTFMNQKTKAMTAAAAIAHKFGFAVIYCSMKRVKPGSYTLEYTAVCDDASEMSAALITEKYYSLLQKDVEEQPENYLWSHKRWKHIIQ